MTQHDDPTIPAGEGADRDPEPPATPAEETREASAPAIPPAMGMPPELPMPAPPAPRRPTAYVAVVIGLLAMVAGAIYFARSFGGATGGADTPQAAVRQLFDAISREDALGALETLLPSERDLFTRSLQDITKELGRLRVLSDDLDLGAISGIDLRFDGIVLSQAEVAPGFVTVSVEGGTSRYRVDPARSPLGAFVRGLLPPAASQVVQGTDDLSDDDITFTAVREGGEWFVSLWYSVAEEGRSEAGLPVPAFGKGLAARGAATPEEAVDGLIRAAASLDVRRLIELMPPDEARALHDYAPLFIDDAEAAAREGRSHFRAQIRTLELTSAPAGGTAVVKIEKMAFAVQIPDVGVSVDYDGRCVTAQGEFFGLDEAEKLCDEGFAPATGLPVLPAADVGFVAVQRDGLWYVSPTRTVLDGMLGVLKVLQPSHLDQFKEFFSTFGFSEGFTDTVELTPPRI